MLVKNIHLLNKHQLNTIFNLQIAKLITLLSLLFGIGLATKTVVATPQPILNQVKQATPKQQVDFLNGTWEGTYTCRQGLTNLKLSINTKSLDEINAIFVFSPHPSQPNVPSGSFKMVGTYKSFNSPDIPGVLSLQGTDWINRPNGYMTVDLSANVTTEEKSISGNVITSGCSTFTITKVKNPNL